VFHLRQQAPHPLALMVPGDCLMQLVPQPFDDVYPRGIDRLELQLELPVILQPGLGFPTLMDDVVVEDQGDGFGASVVDVSGPSTWWMTATGRFWP